MLVHTPTNPLVTDSNAIPEGNNESCTTPDRSQAGRSLPLGGGVALAIGFLAAFSFVQLATVNLSAQGLYHDEVHQAPAAFAYVGKRAQICAMAFVAGKPLMTMTYSGAIKPALYGLYLRFTGASFTVESWRWLGIAVVALTFPLFSVLARKRLSTVGLLSFFALLTTDATVVLVTRHDWGPTALALALRLIFLGVWLYGEADGAIKPRNSFVLGLIVGFSIYEKLSNIVLLLPLSLVLLCRERRQVSHWRASLAGGLLGGLPLLYVNYRYFWRTGELLSTRQVAAQGVKSLASLTHFLRDYLALGDGSLVRQFILGQNHGFVAVEGLLLTVALVAVVCLWRAAAVSRTALIPVVCYLAVGAALFLLPNLTWVHHWVIGTPFQYLAIAMVLSGSGRRLMRPSGLALASRAALISAFGVLMIVRAQGAVDLTCSLARGDSSEIWEPSLTRLGELCAKRAGQDLFLAANWGVAAQIYCLSDGHPKVVRELFAWMAPATPDELLLLGRFRSFYILQNVHDYFPGQDVSRRLFTVFEEHPNLREVSVENDLAQLAAVKVRRFVYSEEGSPQKYAQNGIGSSVDSIPTR